MDTEPVKITFGRGPLTTHPGTRRGTARPFCLFEWNDGGHFPSGLAAPAEALTPVARVVLAASDPLIDQLSDLDLETYSLARPDRRSVVATSGSDQTPRTLAERELQLLRDACETIKPDHCFHLFTDPLLRWWLREDQMPTPMTITIFHPMAHYHGRLRRLLFPRGSGFQAAYLELQAASLARPSRCACRLHPRPGRGPPAGRADAEPRPAGSRIRSSRRRENRGPGRREGCVLLRRGSTDARDSISWFDAIAIAPDGPQADRRRTPRPSVQDEFDGGVARMRAVGGGRRDRPLGRRGAGPRGRPDSRKVRGAPLPGPTSGFHG